MGRAGHVVGRAVRNYLFMLFFFSHVDHAIDDSSGSKEGNCADNKEGNFVDVKVYSFVSKKIGCSSTSGWVYRYSIHSCRGIRVDLIVVALQHVLLIYFCH